MNNLQKMGQPATRIAGTILFLAMLNILFWMPAWAATDAADAVVGNGSPASCTEAALATALEAGGTVTFNCGAAAHTIFFSDAKSLNVNVTLDGGDLITLSGNNVTRLFNIPDEVTVTFRRLVLIDSPASAAGVYNSGTLRVEQSTFDNHLRGAIYNAGGTITVISSAFANNKGSAIVNENAGTLSVFGSTFTDNSTIGSGNAGAIYGSTGSTNTIANSYFEGNKAEDGAGGAIYNSFVMTIENTTIINNIGYGGGGIQNNGTLTVINSRITHNQAIGSGGGGIGHFNQSQTPSKLTLIQSTVDDNTSQQGGGGIWFSGEFATMEAVNSTIYSNTATTIGGGGLYVNSGGDATLTNVTFNNNTSLDSEGDDVENSDDLPGTIMLRNTLVVGGACSGTVTDGDGNLESPGASCGFDTASADPGVGALTNNGGRTATQAITEGGPAQNTAINANCPATDQRGVLRPQFTTCDIGAFEWGALPILTSIAPQSTIALSPTFTLVVNGSNFIPGTLGSVVLWGGEALPTTYVSGTELRATVDANRIVAGGLISITVQTPVIDGGESEHSEIFTIFKRDQSINFAELADRGVTPATFNVTASATSGLPVSFSATGVCTVAGNTVTLTGVVGTCTITAQQAGNQSYNAAPNVARSFAVTDDALLYLPLIFGKE